MAFSNVILAVGIRVEIYLAGRGQANAGGCSENNSDGMHFGRRRLIAKKYLEDAKYSSYEEKCALYAFIRL